MTGVSYAVVISIANLKRRAVPQDLVFADRCVNFKFFGIAVKVIRAVTAVLMKNNNCSVAHCSGLFFYIGMHRLVMAFSVLAEDFRRDAIAVSLTTGIVFAPQDLIPVIGQHIQHVFGIRRRAGNKILSSVRREQTRNGNGR